MALLGGAPRRGKRGILTYVVPAEFPSYDGHREYTFAMLRPPRPFLKPADPGEAGESLLSDFVGDLALEVPEPTDGGKEYTLKLRRKAKFWSGQWVTAHDVVASYNKVIFPAEGVTSTVDKVYAKDD